MCACPWFSFRKLGILSPFPQATARRKTFRALRSCSVFSVLGCVCLGIVITDACCIGYRGCLTLEWQMIITIVISIVLAHLQYCVILAYLWYLCVISECYANAYCYTSTVLRMHTQKDGLRHLLNHLCDSMLAHASTAAF
jgi:hypothetical protein